MACDRVACRARIDYIKDTCSKKQEVHQVRQQGWDAAVFVMAIYHIPAHNLIDAEKRPFAASIMDGEII